MDIYEKRAGTFALVLEGEPISADKLEAVERAYAKDAYFTETIRFCRAWLSGAERFSLRTSGSTGKPKPIQLKRSQMEASARATLSALGLAEGDSALVCLNADYIAGRMMLVRGMVGGLRLTVVKPSANPLEAFPKGVRFDFTALVPMQAQRILEGPPEQVSILNGMKAVLVGGAPVGHSLRQKIRERLTAPAFATYGMTETATHVALKDLRGQSEDYRALTPEIAFGQDARGCLTVTAPVTEGVRLTTNDRVELLDAQAFRWLGRADNVVNSGGVKVQAEAVESAAERAFASLGLERRLFVAGLPDEELGERVTLVVEGKAFEPSQESDLIASLKGALHPYEVPKSFLYAPAFAETETGKVQRSETLRNLGA